MPTQKVTYSKDKAVLVRVYVEKPRKKRTPSIQQYHHHHHIHYHIHHTFRQEVVHGSANGYDRRAGLLTYSRLLRESARRASSTPLLSTWVEKNNPRTPTQISPSKKKPRDATRPACFGNWKQLIPSFLRSWSNAPKKQKKKWFSGNEMKILQVRRGRSLIPNVFSTTRKRA